MKRKTYQFYVIIILVFECARARARVCVCAAARQTRQRSSPLRWNTLKRYRSVHYKLYVKCINWMTTQFTLTTRWTQSEFNPVTRPDAVWRQITVFTSSLPLFSIIIIIFPSFFTFQPSAVWDHTFLLFLEFFPPFSVFLHSLVRSFDSYWFLIRQTLHFLRFTSKHLSVAFIFLSVSTSF